MVSPSVICREVDKSSVKLRGMNSSLIHLDTSAFQAGRRIGKTIANNKYIEFISSRWGMLYCYGNVRTPELYYAAHNPAFANSKSKLPRGVERKLARIARANEAVLKEVRKGLESKNIFEAMTPTCGKCGSGPMRLGISTSRFGKFVCKSCDNSIKLSPTGRIIPEVHPYHVKCGDEFGGGFGA